MDSSGVKSCSLAVHAFPIFFSASAIVSSEIGEAVAQSNGMDILCNGSNQPYQSANGCERHTQSGSTDACDSKAAPFQKHG